MASGDLLRLSKRRGVDNTVSKTQRRNGRAIGGHIDRVIPVDEGARIGREILQLLHNLRIARLARAAELPHVVAVQKIDGSFLADRGRKMRKESGLIGQDEHWLAQIQVVSVEIDLVPRREPVSELKGAVALSKLENGLAEIDAGGERTIRGSSVNVAFAVSRKATSSLPNRRC